MDIPAVIQCRDPYERRCYYRDKNVYYEFLPSVAVDNDFDVLIDDRWSVSGCDSISDSEITHRKILGVNALFPQPMYPDSNKTEMRLFNRGVGPIPYVTSNFCHCRTCKYLVSFAHLMHMNPRVMDLLLSILAMCTGHNPTGVSLDYGTRVEISVCLRRLGGISYSELSNMFYGKNTVINTILGADGNIPLPYVSYSRDNSYYGVDGPLVVDFTLGGLGYDCRVTSSVSDYTMKLNSTDSLCASIVMEHLLHPMRLILVSTSSISLSPVILFFGRLYDLKHGVYFLRDPVVSNVFVSMVPSYNKIDGILVKKFAALVPFKVVNDVSSFMVVPFSDTYSLPHMEFRYGDDLDSVVKRLFSINFPKGFVVLPNCLQLDYVEHRVHYFYYLRFCRADGALVPGLRWFRPDIPCSFLLQKFYKHVLSAIDSLDDDLF